MAKAYLDTTILADILLKHGCESGQKAAEAVARFARVELHGYAIKELKAGVLKNFAWVHNKLAATGSYYRAIDALHSMSLTPRRYTVATALEALRGAARAIGRSTPSDLQSKYGSKAKLDAILADRFRLNILQTVRKAWSKRRDVGTVTYALGCYEETAPTKDAHGWLDLSPTTCSLQTECCMAVELRSGADDLRRMRNAILKTVSSSREDQRKTRAIKDVLKGRALTDKICRDLGDVIFCFFAPSDAVILTTNTKDYKILAPAVDKQTSSM